MATSSGVICGVCDVNFANCWCPECEEGLCSNCEENHRNANASRTHGCISVDQYNELLPFISEIVQHCEDHRNKYTNYCSHHDKLCCPDCISTTHRECIGFLSVQEIIKTAKTSTLLDNMEQSLDDIENNIEKVIQNRENNLSHIRQQRQKIHDKIKQDREKMNSLLDTLEQNLITELDKFKNKIQTKLESLISHLSKERTSIHKWNIYIKTLKKNASDFQTFLGSKTFQPEVEKAEKYMESLSEDGSLKQMNLEYSSGDKILDTLRTLTFGSVSEEKGPPSLVLNTEKDKQAMTAILQKSPKSINDIKLSLLKTYEISKPGGIFGWSGAYRGCIIHPSGKSILTDKASSKLIVLNDDGTVENDITCSSYLHDVTTIDDRTVAVSTENGIHTVNIKQTEKLYNSDRCYGITYNEGTLLWCEQCKGLQKMDLSNGRITTLVKQDQLTEGSYITTHGDKIYQTNQETKTVTCYTIEGERLWEYKDKDVLKDPTGITADSNGNIYVTSDLSHNVVVITADGKEGKQLLSKTDGLSRPWGIFYEKVKNNVLIVNREGPALLYHVS